MGHWKMATQSDELPVYGFFKLNFMVYLICVIWLLIILIVPYIEPEGSIDFGDSKFDAVGSNEHFSDIERMNNPFVRAVYHSGDRMCHTKGSRSFYINSNQMAYCARDIGVFIGFVIGAAISSFVIIDLKWYLVVFGIAPIGLDGGIQLITNYESNNIMRILTGSLAGMITMIAFGLIIYEISRTVQYKLEYKAWAKKYLNPPVAKKIENEGPKIEE
jgi:uncharacterized membrane protein